MDNTIRTTTLLGALSISVWEARKIDRGTARKAEAGAGAKAGTVSATKHLLAGVKELKDVKDYATRVRVWWSQATVPWFDNGPRAFNAAAAVDLQTQIGDHRREFFRLVDEFMPKYPAARMNAQFEMGDLFDANEFPASEVVRAKFKFAFEIGTVPNRDDIRIVEGLVNAEALEKEITEREKMRVQESMRHATQRLFDVVESMHKTMATPIGEAGSKFNDSKLENILELVEIMPGLNLINDPELNKLTAKAKLLATKSPDELRQDETKRAAAAKEAKALATKLAGLFQ